MYVCVCVCILAGLFCFANYENKNNDLKNMKNEELYFEVKRVIDTTTLKQNIGAHNNTYFASGNQKRVLSLSSFCCLTCPHAVGSSGEQIFSSKC